MSLSRRIGDPDVRAAVAADAVAEAELAVKGRGGIRGASAQLGLDTINRLRPGFLERHVHAMLPDLAQAIQPVWEQGVAAGDPVAHLNQEAEEVTGALLTVTDAYVSSASDAKAIAVYERLRPHAPDRISAQMPRIARFIDRHTPRN